jgi:hypothetical protein
MQRGLIALYDICLVLDWNLTPRRRNRRSGDILPPLPPRQAADRGLHRRFPAKHAADPAASAPRHGRAGSLNFLPERH